MSRGGDGRKIRGLDFRGAAAAPLERVPPPFKNRISRRMVGAMDVAQPPAHLSVSAREWWRTTVERFILEEHHLRLLQLACESWDRCQAARQILETEGLTVQNEAGIKPHPCIAIERDSRLAVARLIRELDLDTEPPTANRFGPPSLFSNRRVGNARKTAAS
jgi:P27 family predicted phage terminase small subunit